MNSGNADRLTVEVDSQPAQTTLRLIGQADTLSSASLETEVRRLAAAKPTLVIVDLSELTLISSLAIGLLVSLTKNQSQNGGRAQLRGAHGIVAEALNRTRVVELFS